MYTKARTRISRLNRTNIAREVGMHVYEKFFINGELIRENILSTNYSFLDTGFINIKISVSKPNDCPEFLDFEKTVYVIPDELFELIPSQPVVQCPKEEFEDVFLQTSYQDPNAFYVWEIDTDTIKQGFGEEDLYNFTITKELIFSGKLQLVVIITYPNGCEYRESIQLNYPCEITPPVCVCIDPVEIEIAISIRIQFQSDMQLAF